MHRAAAGSPAGTTPPGTGTQDRTRTRLMNGRYLIVERIAVTLLAALFLAGCGPDDAQRDGEARPGPGTPAAREQPDMTPGPEGGMVSDDPDRTVSSTPDGSADGASADASSGTAVTSGSTTNGGGPGRSRQPSASPPSSSGTASTGGGSSGSVEPASRQASPDAILRATSRAYEDLRSFRATFEQTLQNTLLGRTTRSVGTLYQRQPDRFLMDFSDPAGDRIVSDGRYFWMYFPSVDAKQVIRSSGGARGLDLHSQFIGDPVERFETTYHGTEAVHGRRAHVMTLVPRQALGYQRLKVWIDANDHLVRRFELTENNGNIRHFVLDDLTKNPSLSDDLFEFTPPAGSQVVER